MAPMLHIMVTGETLSFNNVSSLDERFSADLVISILYFHSLNVKHLLLIQAEFFIQYFIFILRILLLYLHLMPIKLVKMKFPLGCIKSKENPILITGRIIAKK